MKTTLTAVMTLTLGVTLACGQTAVTPLAPVKILTTPKPPSAEVLDRLSLTQAWRVKVKLDGGHDGLLSVQVIPGVAAGDTPQVIVQTLQGGVLLLDGETGDLLWRTDVGQAGWPGQPAAYNSNSILVVRREFLYVLNRSTGAHRVFKTDPRTQMPVYGYQMLAVPSAPPVADEIGLYLVMRDRVMAYALPAFGAADKVKVIDDDDPATRFRQQAYSQPELGWMFVLPGQSFYQAPLVTANRVAVVSTEGTFYSLNKFERKLLFDFKFNGPVSAVMAQHGDVAYIGSADTIVYAINIVNGRLLWRNFSSAPLERRIEATDRDVFVAPGKLGLTRLDRDSGRDVWNNATAQRFLSTDFKYLWAVDRIGQLLVLDYHRGTTLAKYNTSDWVVPVSNDLTDRFLFANHDGQIICLHHRDHRRPVRTKYAERPPEQKPEEKKEVEPPPEPGKKVKKIDDKKIDDKKVDDKKVDDKKVDDKKVDDKKVKGKDADKDNGKAKDADKKDKQKEKDNGKDKDKAAARGAEFGKRCAAAATAWFARGDSWSSQSCWFPSWFPNSVWQPRTAKLCFATRPPANDGLRRARAAARFG